MEVYLTLGIGVFNPVSIILLLIGSIITILGVVLPPSKKEKMISG